MKQFDSILIIDEGLTAIDKCLGDMKPGRDYDALAYKRDEIRVQLDYLTKGLKNKKVGE